MAVVALALVSAAGCSVWRNDRMWIPEPKFEEARHIYDRTGSLALTEKALSENPQWQRGEVNQAVYRLRKINHLE
jgi:hypothetical protein